MDGTPKRTRTAVAGVKGRRPRPLDDGGALAISITETFLSGKIFLCYSSQVTGCK